MESIEKFWRESSSNREFKEKCLDYFYSIKDIKEYIYKAEVFGVHSATKQYLENRQNKQKENNMSTKNTECDVKSNTNVTTEIGTTKVAYATRSKDVVGMVTDSYNGINELIASTVFYNTESFKENLQSELRAERAELAGEYEKKGLILSHKYLTKDIELRDKEMKITGEMEAFRKDIESCNDKRIKEGIEEGIDEAVAEATKDITSDKLDMGVRLEKSGRENKALKEKLRNYSEGMEIDFLFNYFNKERKNLGLFGDSGTKKHFDTILNALHIIRGTW